MTTEPIARSSAWSNDSGRSVTEWIVVSAKAAASADDVRKIDLRPFVERSPSWLGDVDARIDDMQSRDIQVSQEALRGARTILTDPIFAGTPRPIISPIEGGGISAEFRAPGVELLVELSGIGEAEAYVLQPGVYEWEGDLADLPDGIEKWAWRLAHPGV